jgi:DmsE family decaheme c-type cytochrome
LAGWAVAGTCLLAACVTSWVPGPQFYHRTDAVFGAEPVGEDECDTCHDEVNGRAPAPSFHAECEGCHGPGSLHADSEEPADIRFPASADCLACHGKGRSTHMDWQTAAHERAGLLCSDCHAPHSREPGLLRTAARLQGTMLPLATPTTRLCVSCHPAIASRLNLPSHHPVREGMLDCTDCHQPHEDRRFTLGERTALCSGCHQDHAGPWIYEHPPVAEDCGYCHDPHGAPAYNLQASVQPASCLECHSLADSTHVGRAGVPEFGPITPAAAGTFLNRCTDCHGAIHGSYQDPHLRR